MARHATNSHAEVKTTADLRKLLIQTIEQVRDGTIDPRQAGAIASLSGKVLMSARLDLDAIRLNIASDGKMVAGAQVLQLVGPPQQQA